MVQAPRLVQDCHLYTSHMERERGKERGRERGREREGEREEEREGEREGERGRERERERERGREGARERNGECIDQRSQGTKRSPKMPFSCIHIYKCKNHFMK